jgi:phosphoribosyl 1,2-cyclic phosphodiesterase
MSLYVTSLNSGSNGNCYYIGNDEDAVLIDAGISCRETEKRMRRLGLKIETVKAVFISHEHGDHIRGAEGIAAKFGIPIYITPATLTHSKLRINAQQIVHFAKDIPIQMGTLTVTAFAKKHDAIDPHSFVIRYGGVSIGVFTDIGVVCDQVARYFSHCHAVFLEANYDHAMLQSGRYPAHLKKRISGGHGHLSNLEAFELFCTHGNHELTHLFLSHLSKENNTPELALQQFAASTGNTRVLVASRDVEMPIFNISGTDTIPEVKETKRAPQSIQINLF